MLRYCLMTCTSIGRQREFRRHRAGDGAQHLFAVGEASGVEVAQQNADGGFRQPPSIR